MPLRLPEAADAGAASTAPPIDSKYDGIEINCEEITRKKRKST